MEALKYLLETIAPDINPQGFLGHFSSPVAWYLLGLVFSFGGCVVRHHLALAVTRGDIFPIKDLYPTLMPNKRTLFCVRYGLCFSIGAVASLCEKLL